MPEKTKNGDIEARPVSSWVWITLFVLAIGAYFAGLDMPLVGPDEPRYAQVAREMFERGDAVTPFLGGYHWFEKPALLYWLQIASYSLFGVNEFAARLGSAIFGLGTAASLWFLGRSVAGENGVVGLGSLLALISASTLGIIVFAHGASFDIIVTFPMTAALVSFIIYDRSESHSFMTSTVPLLLLYFFIGVSLLAKGLIGIVFPFAIIAFYHVISRKLPDRKLVLSLFWGTALAIAVAATWYLPMYMRHGYEFIDEFFLQHHFQRFTSNKYQHPQPFYFFLWVLPLMTIPWLPFFGAAIVGQVRGLIGSRSGQSVPISSDVLRFAWAWLLVPLVFFSLSGSKLPGYILPAVPAAVIVSGLYIHRLVARSILWRNIVLGTAAIMFVVLIVVSLTVAPRFANDDSIKPLIEAADARGHSAKPVLMYLRISHSAEFYAAGRLSRDEDGRLLRLTSRDDLLRKLRGVGGPSVVLVPREYAHQLTNSPEFAAQVLGSNDEFDAMLVTALN